MAEVERRRAGSKRLTGDRGRPGRETEGAEEEADGSAAGEEEAVKGGSPKSREEAARYCGGRVGKAAGSPSNVPPLCQEES